MRIIFRLISDDASSLRPACRTVSCLSNVLNNFLLQLRGRLARKVGVGGLDGSIGLSSVTHGVNRCRRLSICFDFTSWCRPVVAGIAARKEG